MRRYLTALATLCLAFFITCSLSAQALMENPIKKQLREGKPVIGLTVTIPSPDVAVQAASLGFDYIWIDMEHSPVTLETAHNMVLALRGTSTVPIVRVPANELWLAKRALDGGALGVIFPFTSTPELAKRAVDACKYPPAGKRGSGPGLASMRWPAPGGYADFADKNAMVIIIIETVEAVENIEAIASVPGIDVMFIGANDLSYSYGFRGRQDVPKVQEAIRKIVETAKKHNIPVGRPTLGSDVKDLVQQGFTFIQAGSELSFIGTGSKPLLDALGKSGVDLKSRPLY